MRPSYLQGIAALMAASGTAVARNLTAARPRATGDIIPYTEIRCTGTELDKEAITEAKEYAVRWGRHSVVPQRSVVWWNDHANTVSVWICNCKHVHNDPVRRDELDEAQDLIYAECGMYQSGWVWSKPWDKGFNFEPMSERAGKRRGEICPPNCLTHPESLVI